VKQLTWNQIHLKRGYLTVGKSKTEAGEGRTIPLNSALSATMNEYAEWYQEIFSNPARMVCVPFQEAASERSYKTGHYTEDCMEQRAQKRQG